MEIAKASEVLGMELNEVEEKYMEICDKNGLDNVEDWKLSLSLFRQWFSGTVAYKDSPAPERSSNSLVKTAKGYFISVDAARDMAGMQNERIKNEYIRDPTGVFSSGKVATVMLAGGGHAVTRMYNGEEQTVSVAELPKNNFEIDSGQWIIPLDNMPAYGERANPNYGKPLPHEQFRMAGVFIGTIEGAEEKVYYFSYKGEASKDFCPNTFSLLEIQVIPDSNNLDRMYGFKTGTLESLVYTEEEQPTLEQLQSHVMAHAVTHYSPLIDLNRYHTTVGDKRYAERFVISDGSVSSVNMTPNSFGTRRVTITDLNSDFDYDGGQWAGTTCWVPSHIDIEFGIGSNVLVVGRTSQGRNDDGSLGDITLNVSGLLCVENRGAVVEPFEAEEDDLDWF